MQSILSNVHNKATHNTPQQNLGQPTFKAFLPSENKYTVGLRFTGEEQWVEITRSSDEMSETIRGRPRQIPYFPSPFTVNKPSISKAHYNSG